jgi:hypothetical protein
MELIAILLSIAVGALCGFAIWAHCQKRIATLQADLRSTEANLNQKSDELQQMTRGNIAVARGHLAYNSVVSRRDVRVTAVGDLDPSL